MHRELLLVGSTCLLSVGVAVVVVVVVGGGGDGDHQYTVSNGQRTHNLYRRFDRQLTWKTNPRALAAKVPSFTKFFVFSIHPSFLPCFLISPLLIPIPRPTYVSIPPCMFVVLP